MNYTTIINGKSVAISDQLITACDQPIPRYTSYPTVPAWKSEVTSASILSSLEQRADRSNPISLYFHIPFCEEHCHFCGCNTVITKKHDIANSYLDTIEAELEIISSHGVGGSKVTQLHFGGGTPTYLSLEQIQRLWEAITKRFSFQFDSENSIEVDPRVTTHDQLALLKELGANRISMGVQDNDSKVQLAINRIQPLSTTSRIMESARKLGYGSVNIDLMYGLPFQTPESFHQTVSDIIALQPDRIALFNFAYVPWLKANQRVIDEKGLPEPSVKFTMFCQTITQLYEAGYLFIGMDHFAKPQDELAKALKSRTMWRNFQGYTTKRGVDLLAFGITSISDLQNCYYQNTKKLTEYGRAVQAGELPLERGCFLTADDLLRRRIITEIFCNHYLDKEAISREYDIVFDDYFAQDLKRLSIHEKNGLVTHRASLIEVTDLGKLFIRNVGSVFDAYLHQESGKQTLFSRAI